ncbi:hypothetical protein H0H87_005733 [Tephrocybe sp. NHM501043]|nr:hypothetical protein H0H87_005733 [Tephrocybe sp. NHM501043]
MYRRWDQHELYAAAPRPPRPSPPPWPPYAAATAPPYTHDALAPRMSLAGSLDPATGIFYRSPEHPRLRTAQACEKCRTRKAKCSGEHPTCKRCSTRGLVCEYAKEGRVRGPNKPKPKAPPTSNDPNKPKPNDVHDHSDTRPVRPRPSSLRLDPTPTPQPHHPSTFVNTFAHPDSADSCSAPSPQYERRSCSLSESGGSVYPPAVRIPHLAHDQQRRLLQRHHPLDLEPQRTLHHHHPHQLLDPHPHHHHHHQLHPVTPLEPHAHAHAHPDHFDHPQSHDDGVLFLADPPPFEDKHRDVRYVFIPEHAAQQQQQYHHPRDPEQDLPTLTSPLASYSPWSQPLNYTYGSGSDAAQSYLAPRTAGEAPAASEGPDGAPGGALDLGMGLGGPGHGHGHLGTYAVTDTGEFCA